MTKANLNEEIEPSQKKLPWNKVAILSPAHPLRGGIAASTERLAIELQSDGYEVNIYSFKLQYPSFLFPGKTQYSTDPAPKGLWITSVVNSINPFNWFKIGLRLRREKPDLIIVRYWLAFMAPCMGTILRIVSGNRHTKILAIVDNMIPHETHPGHQFLSRYFVNGVDGFIAMSKSVETDIRTLTATKPIVYVPHPIYDNYGKQVERSVALRFLNLSAEFNYLLFFGFIRDYKGLDLLLEAIADPRIKAMKLKLIVAGEFYSNQEKYEQIIQEYQLEDQVILKSDFIPSDEVRYYFGATNLVTQPYKSATQSGISQLAYHFEKPILVTGVGGLPEIIEHGKVGYVVDVQVEAIADAIVDFFEKNREAEMVKGVQENKVLFSWNNMVKGIEAIYPNL